MNAVEISTAEHPAVWRPCPTCWGQRRVFEDRNGAGLVPHPCPACLGIGEELAAPVPAPIPVRHHARGPEATRRRK